MTFFSQFLTYPNVEMKHEDKVIPDKWVKFFSNLNSNCTLFQQITIKLYLKALLGKVLFERYACHL